MIPLGTEWKWSATTNSIRDLHMKVEEMPCFAASVEGDHP
jgi:hypothetical protein